MEEVVIVIEAVILEEEIDPMVASSVALIRGSNNVSIVRRTIISLRSAERSLVTLNGLN